LGGKLYPALLEGVGFAERLAFERMMKLGCPVGDTIFATGGACRSDVWLKIRASILNRRLAVPRVVDAAMGSALLAASGHFGSLKAAAAAMISFDKEVEPEPAWVAPYEEAYRAFEADCAKLYRMEG
jgi:xylulokinase